MAAKDTFHDAVKSALQKEAWNITHDPLYINFAEVEIYSNERWYIYKL
ncbi:element excision factor XisH family protein [Hydrocoleum sp. CS-953]|nr:element excision factor XisH family protein [Hydrocoleum sp. CS-953]